MNALLRAIRNLLVRQPAPRRMTKSQAVRLQAQAMRHYARQQDALWGGRWRD